MRIIASSIALGFGVTLLLFSPALAVPVNSADLSAQKFCWDGGGGTPHRFSRGFLLLEGGVE
jgi:hypothetical protein